MCTVTLIPKNISDFILTSNRDESPNRSTIHPNIYTVLKEKLLYPKDEFAGGTWIGASSKNRALCLLNGAFICHTRQKNYKLSRGVVVKELLVSDNIEKSIKVYDFENIEPFTLIIVDWQRELRFFEFVWDGKKKHLKQLEHKPYIWSSSTLYSEEMKKERRDWFELFKEKNILEASSLLDFHTNTKKDNKHFGVIMDREFVKTTSITQIEKLDDCVSMHFLDLKHKKQSTTTLNCLETIHD